VAEAIGPMRLRAVRQGDRVVIKVLMAHPMDTGLAKDAEGKTIPAWYIEQVAVWLDDQPVLSADWGPAVSRNPFLEFELLAAAPGAVLRVSWRDNCEGEREDRLVVA
jgi:sulfur-oxidizing protein SoxZ